MLKSYVERARKLSGNVVPATNSHGTQEVSLCQKGQIFVRYLLSAQALLLSDRPVNLIIQERRPVKRFVSWAMKLYWLIPIRQRL